ncbi:hypothetical protein RI129_012095 [Pyrocoelia pectoralis]|uniref:YqaJ viral recombinase domain-containing protein n=1 Tax=Pyrocoelia pectoralis TaxID=417401 RepID=A0AAN7V5T2_9COLE
MLIGKKKHRARNHLPFLQKWMIFKSECESKECPVVRMCSANVDLWVRDPPPPPPQFTNPKSYLLSLTSVFEYGKNGGNANTITGRRIINMEYFLHALKSLKHEGFQCSFYDLNFVSEQRYGYISKLTFKCKVCNYVDSICTDKLEETEMNLNMATVSATISIGAGYSQLKEFSSALNIPTPSSATYGLYQEKVFDIYNLVAVEEMETAAKEEARLALENGEVDKDGYPLIAVIADGAWSKRSYRTNYNALSGVACILGLRTKKVIYMSVKNKFCIICARKDRYVDGKRPEHICYKNWSGTSTGMEAAIIVEGFKNSVNMYGIKYIKLVGDGDSSVYRKLREVMPYGPGIMIQKIECKNHILRNYINKLKELSKKPKTALKLKNALFKNLLRFRTAITKAIEYRKSQSISLQAKIKELEGDILNGPKHILGDHSGCSERGYFCKGPKEDEQNLLPELRNCELYQDLMTALQRVVTHANSLIHDVTNNAAELYNSQVAKFVGGKRVCFSFRRSYEARCAAAVISHNKVGDFHDIIRKHVTDTPAKYTSQYCENRRKRNQQRLNAKMTHKKRCVAEEDLDYGPEAGDVVPDMDNERRTIAEETFLQDLAQNIKNIAQDTLGQHRNNRWHEERLKRLTASRFGRICKMKSSTSCANAVKDILYTNFFGNAATRYGVENEHRAIEAFQAETNEIVSPCGLYIREDFPFLAASPDGLVGEDALIEVKCPYTARKHSPHEATQQKEIKFCEIKNGNVMLKTNHDYYYQIQGQLNICNKNKCFFVVWSPVGISIQTIYKDLFFWETKMLPKLQQFYMAALLPELVDPRQIRKLPIRETFLKPN